MTNGTLVREATPAVPAADLIGDPVAPRALLSWLAWGAVLAAVTMGMYAVRADLGQVQVVLIYLLIVLGASATGSRALGVSLAFAASLLLDYFFQAPYNTFSVDSVVDWEVLIAFLATSLVTTHLLVLARERTEEVSQLARLGSEALSGGAAVDALPAMARVIRDTLQVEACRIDAGSPVDTSSDDSRHLVVPLEVHGKVVGALHLENTVPIWLTPARQRFLRAMSWYAALAAERVRLIAEAERAKTQRETTKMREALIAGVSHDLRTPLATIKALAEDARRRGDSGAAVIESEADRLTRFVTDMLDFSRFQSDAFIFTVEVNAAEDLLGAAVQQSAAALAGRDVRKSVNYEGPVLLGRFDFIQSLRVLSNLIENAARYSPPGSPIELAVTREGDFLCFTVADRGTGINAVDADRIFEPFYRGPSASPDTGGAGLGLAIARHLARGQGGDVTHAPRSGGGTVFTARLSAVDGPA
jgi:two-component system sensor histidine kinase KdpD